MATRKAISTKTRFDIFKRDSFTCQYCGSTPPAVLLQVDHIVPVFEGGGNETDNLTTACQGCNAGKGARSLDAVPQALKDRAEDVAERERQLRGYHNVMEARRQRLEQETWEIIEAIECRPVESYDRRNIASVRRFLEALPFHTVLEATDIASVRFQGYKRFRYFCGICWNKIKRGEHVSD